MNYINPFSDYGKIVQNDRFIGRKKEITSIQNRLLGSNYGNLAIMGLPRVGKSSLAHNAIYLLKDELKNMKTHVFWINTGSIKSAKSFFLKIAFDTFNSIFEYISELELIDFQKSYDKLNIEDLSDIEFTSYLQNFFRKVLLNNFKLIFILDEFDNSERIFGVEDFQLLRELSNDPSTQLALLTISRRTLQELEPENGAVSNFYQIFSDLHLGFFNDSDFLLYWDFVRKHNVVVNNITIEKVKYFTSAHPFLLDLINNDIFNYFQGHSLNFEEIFNSIIDNLRLKIFNEYGTILKLMKEENLDSKVIQILVGPVYDVKQVEIEKLMKYELIKVKGNAYEGFSPYFSEYLRINQTEIDYWPLWSETERDLRGIVKIFLNEKFGENWIDKFISSNLKKKPYIDNLISVLEKSKKSFRDKASLHLVDYTYPSDIIDCFISSDWSWFKKIFGKDFKDWKPKFDHLARIRTPLAHNNQNFLTEADKNLAVGYCQEIKKTIVSWKLNNNS